MNIIYTENTSDENQIYHTMIDAKLDDIIVEYDDNYEYILKIVLSSTKYPFDGIKILINNSNLQKELLDLIPSIINKFNTIENTKTMVVKELREFLLS